MIPAEASRWKYRTPHGVRLLHYGLPVALGWSIPLAVQRATGQPLLLPGQLFLLLGIAAAYSLDRLLDAPEDGEGTRLGPLLMAAFAGSAALGTAMALLLPRRNLALVLLLVASALAYRRWKRFPFAKTLGVPLAWTWASLVLPFPAQSWFGWRALLTPVAPTLFLLFAAGCLLCDLKDEGADARAGVRSFPVMFGARWTMAAAMVLAVGAMGRAWSAHRPGLAASGAALFILGLFPQLTARGVLGALAVDAALALPGLFIWMHLI